jgi:predicted permease
VFVQASYRGNLGFIGLPLVLYAGSAGDSQAYAALAVLVLAPIAPSYNIGAVLLLLGYQEEKHARNAGHMMRNVATNPIVLAACLGIVFVLCGIRLPGIMDRAMGTLGQTAIPLALLAMGAMFVQVPLRGVLLSALLMSFMKVVMAPTIGLVLAWWWGATAEQARIALLYLATPTAVSSYILVEQLGGNKQLAVNGVIVSTFCSIIPLTVVLWLTTPAVWKSVLAW